MYARNSCSRNNAVVDNDIVAAAERYGLCGCCQGEPPRGPTGPLAAYGQRFLIGGNFRDIAREIV